MIIDDSVDVASMLPLLAKGGFYHAGQVCVSVQRVFIPRARAKAIALQLAELADAMVVGDPQRKETACGPLIRPGECDRIAQWVEEAEAGGGEVLSGGKRLSDSVYAPTVLYAPPRDAKVSQLEIFGPVIAVYPYDTLDEAIAQANAVPYAFQAAVFTQQLDTAWYIQKRLNASAVMINDHSAFRVDWMPFAGRGQSGYGVGGIEHTLADMREEKLLVWRTPA